MLSAKKDWGAVQAYPVTGWGLRACPDTPADLLVRTRSPAHVNNRSLPTRVALVALLIVLAWAGAGVAVYMSLPSWEVRGQFGDVFGAVNALFSGFAFAGLIYAILLQRQDLELQRQELALTRTELARSAKAQEQSELALKAQAHAAERSAKLATINFLLEHYRHELRQFQAVAYPGNDPRTAKRQELELREAALLHELEQFFDEVIADEPSSV